MLWNVLIKSNKFLFKYKQMNDLELIKTYLNFDDNDIMNVASMYREKRDELIKEKDNIEKEKQKIKDEIKNLLYEGKNGRKMRKAYEAIIFWLENINDYKFIDVYRYSKISYKVNYDYRKALEKVIERYQINGDYIKTNDKYSESITYILKDIGDKRLNILSLNLKPLIEEISLYEYKYNYLMDVIDIKKWMKLYNLKDIFIDELLIYLDGKGIDSKRKTNELINKYLSNKRVYNYKFRDVLAYMYLNNKMETN